MPRVTITVPERTPQPYRFQLDRQKVNMGRGSENDIVIDCGSVSVRHAVMERLEGGYQLRDLGSTNGIKLEGVVKDIIPLRHGLSVKIGDVAFDFTLTEEEREALAREKPPEESPIVREEYSGQAPKRAAHRPAPAAHRPLASAQQPSAAASFGMVLLFMLLSAGAFFAGLYIRYSQENDGKSLIEAISKKGAPVAEEKPAAAPEAAPAE